MTPFAIAGVQMHVAAVHENVTAMKHKVELTLARFPWVQMILFSELAPYGPLYKNHPKACGATEDAFRDVAAHYGVWLVPGSMFRRSRGRLYNTASVIDPITSAGKIASSGSPGAILGSRKLIVSAASRVIAYWRVILR